MRAGCERLSRRAARGIEERGQAGAGAYRRQDPHPVRHCVPGARLDGGLGRGRAHALAAKVSLHPRSSAFGTRPSTSKQRPPIPVPAGSSPADDAEILGQQRVARVAGRQAAQHLDQPGLAVGERRQRERVAHDHLGVDRRVQVVDRVLEIHPTHLLDHPVEVDHLLDAGRRLHPAAKRRRVHRRVLQLLPAAGVHQRAALEIEPLAGLLQRLHQVSPHHEGEPEEQDPAPFRLRQVGAKPLEVETHVVPQRVERPVAELRHAQDARATRRAAAAVANDAGMIHDHHGQSVLAQEVLRDLHQHGRLHRRGLRIEEDPARLLAGGAAGGEHLDDLALGHAGEHVGLEQRHRQKRHVFQPLDPEPLGATEDVVQDVPIGRAALRHGTRSAPAAWEASAARFSAWRRPNGGRSSSSRAGLFTGSPPRRGSPSSRKP